MVDKMKRTTLLIILEDMYIMFPQNQEEIERLTELYKDGAIELELWTKATHYYNFTVFDWSDIARVLFTRDIMSKKDAIKLVRDIQKNALSKVLNFGTRVV